MESKVKFLGHGLHQLLVAFPLGLLMTSGIFDALFVFSRAGKWAQTSFYMIGSGLIGGLIAAVFGLLDWIGIPNNTRAKQIGLLHAAGNAAMLGLFTTSWLRRKDAPRKPDVISVVLAVFGLGFGSLSGWLGGELVDRLGVGVYPGAHLNSPSSLSGRPATEDSDEAAKAPEIGYTR